MALPSPQAVFRINFILNLMWILIPGFGFIWIRIRNAAHRTRVRVGHDQDLPQVLVPSTPWPRAPRHAGSGNISFFEEWISIVKYYFLQTGTRMIFTLIVASSSTNESSKSKVISPLKGFPLIVLSSLLSGLSVYSTQSNIKCL